MLLPRKSLLRALDPFGVAATTRFEVFVNFGGQRFGEVFFSAGGQAFSPFAQVGDGVGAETDAEQGNQDGDVQDHPGGARPLTNVDCLPEDFPQQGEDLEKERQEGQDEENFEPSGTGAPLLTRD